MQRPHFKTLLTLSAIVSVYLVAGLLQHPSQPPASKDPKKPISGQVQSLEQMSRFMAESVQPGTNLKTMMQQFDTLRTAKPLPGTRFLRAQFFGPEEEKVLRQMYFEFEDSDSSMQVAERALRKSFLLRAPEQDQVNFKQWNLNNGYVLRIQRLDTREESNTAGVRIAIESAQVEEPDSL